MTIQIENTFLQLECGELTGEKTGESVVYKIVQHENG